MFVSKHCDFILTPIVGILREEVESMALLGSGIETFPIYDTLYQAVFLKMTGFQEQKGKCLLWDVASNDYSYRIDFLKDNYAECSNIDEKQKIIKSILKLILESNSFYSLRSKIQNIIEDSFSEIVAIMKDSGFVSQCPRMFSLFCDKKGFIEKKSFPLLTENGSFFEKAFCDNYRNHLYRHRNRCAHNLKSYQQNLPSFSSLSNTQSDYDNYCYYFHVLNIIDKIYIDLFKSFCEIEQYSWN